MRVVKAVALVRTVGCQSEVSLGSDGQFVVTAPNAEHTLTFLLDDFLRMKEKEFVARLEEYVTEKTIS